MDINIGKGVEIDIDIGYLKKIWLVLGIDVEREIDTNI